MGLLFWPSVTVVGRSHPFGQKNKCGDAHFSFLMSDSLAGGRQFCLALAGTIHSVWGPLISVILPGK